MQSASSAYWCGKIDKKELDKTDADYTDFYMLLLGKYKAIQSQSPVYNL